MPALATIGLLLAGCVAPEAPEPAAAAARAAPSAASASSAAKFEDAPIPNRRVRPNADDPVIRLAH